MADEPPPVTEPAPAPLRSGWLARHAFTLAFSATFVALAAWLLVPVLMLLAQGRLFGADWSEYLYTGPALVHGGALPLLAYPYPVLPLLYVPLAERTTSNPLLVAQVADALSAVALCAVAVAGYFACRAHSGARWAALLGAVVIGTAPLLEREIGWGGQAQLLAFALGLVALWWYLDRVLPSLDYRYAIVSGALLAAGALTESYATATFVLAFVLFVPLSTGRRLFSRRGLGIVAGLFLPLLAVGIVILRTDPALVHPTGAPAISHYWQYAPLYHEMWSALTAGNFVLGAAYVGAWVLYGGFRLATRAETASRRWLVPSFAAAALAIGFFVTPAVSATRAMYALAFPLAFALTEMVSLWPSPPADLPARAPRWGLSRPQVAWAFPVLVVASLAVAGVQAGTDLRAYPDALAHYSFENAYVSDLAFLQGEPGAILYEGAPIDHSFVTQWATTRPVYPGPDFQPYTVTSEPKQSIVELAWALAWGEAWIDAGPYTVTDAGPAWGQPDPGILYDASQTLTMTLESDDFANAVVYSPGANPTASYTADLYQSSTYDRTTSAGGFAVEYGFTGFTVNRTITVATSGLFYWNYTFDFSTAIPHSAAIYLTSPNKVSSSGGIASSCPSCSNGSVALEYPNGALPAIWANYSLAATARNASLTSTFAPSDKYGIFEFEYNLTPTNSSVRSFSVDLAIQPHGLGAVTPTVGTEAATLASTGIEWVVISQSASSLLLQRLMDDPAFALYRTTTFYYVLKVG